MGYLHLRPACYSKAQTIADVTEAINSAPKQESNSPDAFKGKVLEFAMYGLNGPVGTLSEWFVFREWTQYRMIDKIVIHCKDGVVRVNRNVKKGVFKIAPVAPE